MVKKTEPLTLELDDELQAIIEAVVAFEHWDDVKHGRSLRTVDEIIEQIIRTGLTKLELERIGRK